MKRVVIIGGGLAGCECALTLARRGVAVTLYEQKPHAFSPAHGSPGLAELVCSNSLRSDDPASAVGRLKVEMRELGSLTMQAAEATRVPAGKALAVDRELFSAFVTRAVEADPLVTLVRRQIDALDSLDGPDLVADALVVAAGPLASDGLAASLAAMIGATSLYFYDAIAPIVSADSVDFATAFWGSRYKPEDEDYLNCPLTRDEYFAFIEALKAARKVPCRAFEQEIHFEGCLPIEEMAERGERTLSFGPMKPVGLTDPRTGRRPYACVQLRAENAAKTAFNLVGFQTKLAYPEQERVFRMIPGLERADFLRLGSIHRNTYVNAPQVLTPDLELRARPGVYLAGQISGVEGYVESAASGLWLGHTLAASLLNGVPLPPPPQETALGALLNHLRTPAKTFQPSNVNYGLAPDLTFPPDIDRKALPRGKRERQAAYAARAVSAWERWREEAEASGGQRG